MKASLEELKQKLNEKSVVKFSFRKKDNSSREAIATLNEFLIPTTKLPKEETEKNLGQNLKFYDIKKQGWRSLVYDCSTIEIDEDYDQKPWDQLIHLIKHKREND